MKMNIILKILIGIVVAVALLGIGVFLLFFPIRSERVSTDLTKADAISAAILLHPELAAYQTTTLPPSSIESEQVADGWNLGFIQRGSGVPGILSGQCFHVSNTKEVTATGQYAPGTTSQKTVVVNELDLSNCTPKQSSADTYLPYGEPVTFALGGLGVFKDVSIRPLSIEEDSRCPVDVQCIQAGTVRVKVQIVSGMGTSTSVLKLNQEFTTEAESITLISVAPDKNSKVTIGNSDYRLTFVVVKGKLPVTQAGKCYVGGCSSEVCSDEPNAVSNCIYSEKFACYKTAKCERQVSGECGWTQTAQLSSCLSKTY